MNRGATFDGHADVLLVQIVNQDGDVYEEADGWLAP
jgi:hypothetical protein